MSEQEVVDTSAETDDAAIETEVAELIATPAEQQQDKVKNALIASKRESRAQARRIKELEPLAASERTLRQQVESVQPVINAILSNPKLRAEALRIANGTAPSRAEVDQPDAGDDPDAEAFAEDLGMYLSDQTTPDIAKARRTLNRLDARHGRQTDDRIRPLAGVTLGQKADANLREAIDRVDADGVPWASAESIREVADQLPPELKASRDVVKLLLNAAVGIDKEKGRTPKAPAEPLYVASSGGGRREPSNTISSEERKILSRLGLNEKDYKESSARLEDNAARRRGTSLE